MGGEKSCGRNPRELLMKLMKSFDERRGGWRKRDGKQTEKVKLLEVHMDSNCSNEVLVCEGRGGGQCANRRNLVTAVTLFDT